MGVWAGSFWARALYFRPGGWTCGLALSDLVLRRLGFGIQAEFGVVQMFAL